MKYKIKSSDPRVKEVMEKFAKAFEDGYTKELGKWRYRPIRKFLPMLVPIILEDKDGVIFALPVKMPDFNILQNLIQKFTGRRPEPKWKEKTIKNLEGYLKAEGIEAEVTYIGD